MTKTVNTPAPKITDADVSAAFAASTGAKPGPRAISPEELADSGPGEGEEAPPRGAPNKKPTQPAAEGAARGKDAGKPAKKNSDADAPAAAADAEDAEEDGEEQAQRTGRQSQAYRDALKTLALDGITEDDVARWSYDRVLTHAEKRRAVHADFDRRLSSRAGEDASKQGGATAGKGSEQPANAGQGNATLAGLQERHLKRLEPIFEGDASALILEVLAAEKDEVSTALGKWQTDLDASVKATVKGLEESLKEARQEFADYRIRTMAEKAYPEELSDEERWNAVSDQMGALRKTGKYKGPSSERRLLDHAIALVRQDESKFLQTDRLHENGSMTPPQGSALGRGEDASLEDFTAAVSGEKSRVDARMRRYRPNL